MTTNNNLNTSLSGQSGTGSFVGSNAPILVTPNVGASNATSLTFGGGVLSTYSVGSYTPTFTFATVGDLSVSYATQTGFYTKIGRLVFINITLVCTPTYTTASGQARVVLPFTAGGAGAVGSNIGIHLFNSSVTYNGARTTLYSQTSVNGTTVVSNVSGSAIGNTGNNSPQFPSGIQISLEMSLKYTATS